MRVLAAFLLLGLTGCVRFTTTQRELRYDDHNEIHTTATAITFLSGKHALANWRAAQSSGKQEASVGSLSQETEAAKDLSVIASKVAEGVALGVIKSVKPVP